MFSEVIDSVPSNSPSKVMFNVEELLYVIVTIPLLSSLVVSFNTTVIVKTSLAPINLLL